MGEGDPRCVTGAGDSRRTSDRKDQERRDLQSVVAIASINSEEIR